ncbi:hypothetical protein D3C72_883320 [compost metagenome]
MGHAVVIIVERQFGYIGPFITFQRSFVDFQQRYFVATFSFFSIVIIVSGKVHRLTIFGKSWSCFMEFCVQAFRKFLWSRQSTFRTHIGNIHVCEILIGPRMLSFREISGISSRSKDNFVAKESTSIIRIFRIYTRIFYIVSSGILLDFF